MQVHVYNPKVKAEDRNEKERMVKERPQASAICMVKITKLFNCSLISRKYFENGVLIYDLLIEDAQK